MRTRGPGESALLLLDVVDVLRTLSVDYAVVGAMAAAVHGAVRASLDADAIAFVGVAEAQRLARSLADAGFATSVRIGDADDPIGALVVAEDAHGNRVDLLIGLRGVDRSVLARTIDVPLQGATLRVLGREDFIATKLYAGAPKDLADAESAATCERAGLDRALLRTLASRFDRATAARLEHLLRSLDADTG